jgi:hypothetical protein
VYTVFAVYSTNHTLSLPPPHFYWSQPTPRQDLLQSSVSNFVKENKWCFCLFTIGTEGVFS